MVRVVTDSTCDLPREILDRNQITVVPLNIRFAADDYVDGVDLDADQFWQRLRTSGTPGRSRPDRPARRRRPPIRQR